MSDHAHDHDFHIPAGSIWPAITCFGAGFMMFGMVMIMHLTPIVIGKLTFGFGLLMVVTAALQWFKQLITESRERGFNKVPFVLDLGNRYGIIAFIVSEVMFFAAFFAAFFYLRSFNPVWPPENIELLPLDLPIINTLLLLTSGATVTWAHYALLSGNKAEAIKATKATWILGVIFLGFQMFEYSHAAFGLDGGVYGSLFYMLTGFHGFHVLLGTIMLMVVSMRFGKGDFTDKHHFYFEATAWYWHFVDVVWIGLFLFLYVL